MALQPGEVQEGGKVRAGELGPVVVTEDAADAVSQSGFLFDPDGRPVVTTDATDAKPGGGFLRAPNGALVVTTDATDAKPGGGFLRAPGGALVLTSDAAGAVNDSGFLRNQGALVAVGLSGGGGSDPSPDTGSVILNSAAIGHLGASRQGLLALDFGLEVFPADGLTFSCWMKLLDLADQGDLIALGSPDFENPGHINLKMSPGFNVTATLAGERSDSANFYFDTPPGPGEWHHYAAVFGENPRDGVEWGDITVYYDGQSSGPTEPSWPRSYLPLATTLLAVGADWGAHQSGSQTTHFDISYHPGMAAAYNHAAIYQRALSATEIAAIAGGGPPANGELAVSPGPDRLYLMHDGQHPAPDWTGNGPDISVPEEYGVPDFGEDHAPVVDPEEPAPR